MKKLNSVILGVFLSVITYFLADFLPLEEDGKRCLAVVILMVTWWVTEAVSLAVAALLPIALFPLLNVASLVETTKTYSHPIVFLFLGGFILGITLEKWNLHLRIALRIIKVTGLKPDGVILGFMLATFLLSMWISNVAATVMMLPIALSIISVTKEKYSKEKGFSSFGFSLIVCIAYSANIGGIATIIGSPPNAVMVGFMKSNYQLDISFLDWILIGLPFASLLLIIAYFILVKAIYPSRLPKLDEVEILLQHKISELGPISRSEKRIGWIFLVTAFLWIFRPLIASSLSINLSDPLIAVFMSVMVFITPSGNRDNSFLMTWEDTKNLPWGMLILFGGGLSMAGGLIDTGVVEWITSLFDSSTKSVSYFLLFGIIVASMIFLTELMSNLALTTLFLPIVTAIAVAINQTPVQLAMAITMASSCCFMLPVATPANAVVFSSGYLKVRDMLRVGVFINLVAFMLLISIFQFIPD